MFVNRSSIKLTSTKNNGDGNSIQASHLHNNNNNVIDTNYMVRRTFSKASMFLTGSGIPLHKQLKFAILEKNEEKAISIYLNKDHSGKSLSSSLSPSQPFPSKKKPNDQQTPLHLSARFALAKLFEILLSNGGIPSVINANNETSLHSVCISTSISDSVDTNRCVTNFSFDEESITSRAKIIEFIIENPKLNNESDRSVLLNQVDINGNTALHIASFNGLNLCIEKLINYGASLSVFNSYNDSCVDMADKAGNSKLAGMLELAWLYRPMDLLSDVSDNYHKFYNDGKNGQIFLDCNSLTLTSLIQFIEEIIKFTANMLGEKASRAECLLSKYSWDYGKLKNEYNRNPNNVYNIAKLKPKTDLLTGDFQQVKRRKIMSLGVHIDDLYVDPTYQSTASFIVYRDGKKITYNVKNINGKISFIPSETDPIAVNQSDNDSSFKNKSTIICTLCNEMMYEAVPFEYFNNQLKYINKREIRCSSGHIYCFSCWSNHLQNHVNKDNGIGYLPCPGFKCGEILELQWASIMLQNKDLVNRLNAQRQRHVIDCLNLKWCPQAYCGLLINLVSSSNSLPCSAACENAHMFCLSCSNEAHSPVCCADLLVWQEYLREQIKSVNLKDPDNVSNILVSDRVNKPCPICLSIITKDEGCNKISCSNCSTNFCWICLQDWALHTENTGEYFQCNRFMEKLKINIEDDSEKLLRVVSSDEMSEKTLIKKKQQNLHVFIHHFIRFQAQFDSLQFESKMKKEAIARILSGLKQDDLWLFNEKVSNPLTASDDTVSNNINNAKDVTINDFCLPCAGSIRFLKESFNELEKCRNILRWSYPFALFEFEDNFEFNGMKPNRSKNSKDESRLSFDLLQASLESHTELLSNLIARRRIRGDKASISLATRAVKSKRIEFEAMIITYLNDMKVSAAEQFEEGEESTVNSFNSLMQKSLKVNSHNETDSVQTSSKTIDKHSMYFLAKSSTSNDPNEAIKVPNLKSSTTDVDKYRSLSVDDHETVQESTKINKSTGRTFSQYINPMEKYNNYDDNETDLKSQDIAPMIPQKQSPSQKSNIGSESFNSPIRTNGSKNSNSSGIKKSESSGTVNLTNNETNNKLLRSTLSSNTMNTSSNNILVDHSAGANSSSTPVQTRTVFRAGSNVSNQANSTPSPKEHVIVNITYADSMEIELLVSKGLSREQAIRIYFDSHPDKKFDPNATYNIHNLDYDFMGAANIMPLTEFSKIGKGHEISQKAGKFKGLNNRKLELETERDDSPLTIEQRLIGAKKDPDQEALEHGMLLSQQEAEFGVNMYDSLTSDDETSIDDYLKQGFTREEAILILFETKFGKVSTQSQDITPSMPTVHKAVVSNSEDDSKIDKKDEPQIELLMTKGYTREQAIQVFVQRRKKSRQLSISPINIDRSIPPRFPTNFNSQMQQPNASVPTNPSSNVRTLQRTFSNSSIQSSSRSGKSAAQPLTSQLEEKEIELLVSRGYSWDQAYQVVTKKFQADKDSVSFNRSSISSVTESSKATPILSTSFQVAPLKSIDHQSDSDGLDDPGISSLINRGFSRDQAIRMISSSNSSGSNGNVQQMLRKSQHKVTGSFEMTSSSASSGDGEIALLVSRGYSLDQATELHLQRVNNNQLRFPAVPGPDIARMSARQPQPLLQQAIFNNHTNHYRSESHQSLSQLDYMKKSMSNPRQSNLNCDYPIKIPISMPTPVIPSEVTRENSVFNNLKFNHGSYDIKSHHQPWIGARKTPDQQALEIGMLLSQQEAQFGINMYDSLTPADEPEIENLTTLGYSSDDAILMLFERRYKTVPVTSQMNIASGRYVDSGHSAFNNNRSSQHIRHHTTSSMSMNIPSNMPQINSPVAIPRALPLSESFHNQSNRVPSNRFSDSIYYAGTAFPLQSDKFNNSNNSNNSHHSNFSNHSNNSENKLQENDIHTLINMGFSMTDSVRALIENDCNVEVAANVLLGKWG